jgi:prepilin-type N-terminal cleavage/methylation domain-containing protein/prepilin-type processing-associated H-X9-DG protein
MKVVKDARFGFTLIELLVVIAIIAILAAILFPVFSRARDKAQQAACISNLKQVGQAMGLYVDDYDETFPRHPYENVACPADVLAKMHWRAFVTNLFIPYVKNLEVFLCEKGPKRAGSNAANYACPMPPQYLCNYAFNYVILDDPGVGLTPGFSGRLANIQEAARLAVFWDNSFLWIYNSSSVSTHRFWSHFVSYYEAGNFRVRAGWWSTHWHNGMSDYLYADGHVKAGKVGQMTWSNFFNVSPADPRYNWSALQRP